MAFTRFFRRPKRIARTGSFLPIRSFILRHLPRIPLDEWIVAVHGLPSYHRPQNPYTPSPRLAATRKVLLKRSAPPTPTTFPPTVYNPPHNGKSKEIRLHRNPNQTRRPQEGRPIQIPPEARPFRAGSSP